MRITYVDWNTPIHSIDYLHVVPGGGKVATKTLHLYGGYAVDMPTGVEGILITSDLQGREGGLILPPRQRRLLGELLAQEIELLQSQERIPSKETLGIWTCGDLYAKEDLSRRRGSGDCSAVWLSFSRVATWVCGVAGNHDFFPEHNRLPMLNTKISVLDGQSVCLGGLQIGGISGVVGNPRRRYRRSREDMIQTIHTLMQSNIDVLLLHDGPDFPLPHYGGHPDIRVALELEQRALIIRGHAHWPHPLVTLSNGSQVLNVDSLALLLLPSSHISH